MSKEEELLSFVGAFAEDDEWDEIEKQLASNRSHIRKLKRLFNKDEMD